jgi:hypothetical protein
MFSSFYGLQKTIATISSKEKTMNYPGRNGSTPMMGTGYLGETRMTPDGNLYQWVEGIDGLGNPIGFWKRFKRLARRALPYVDPGGVALKALRAAAPVLKQVDVSGYEGLGALYQAPDGTMYQMQGLAEDEMQGLSEDEATQMMGIGYLGEVRQGPDGGMYQWVQGVDGLGNPIGFWKRWRKKLRGLVQKALPFAQKLAPFIPGGSAVLTAATPILQKAGVAGHGGLGALYQAPDGTLYQMQGLAEDEELRGYGEDEDLRGFAEDEDLRGYGEEEALYGYGEDEELHGFDEDEDLRGYGEDEDLRGMEGYIRQDGMSGLEKYVPQQPPMTPGFAPTQAWNPPW